MVGSGVIGVKGWWGSGGGRGLGGGVKEVVEVREGWGSRGGRGLGVVGSRGLRGGGGLGVGVKGWLGV